jgi:hypothetical protein
MGGIHGAISEAKQKGARRGRRSGGISAGNYAPSSARRACPEAEMGGALRRRIAPGLVELFRAPGGRTHCSFRGYSQSLGSAIPERPTLTSTTFGQFRFACESFFQEILSATAEGLTHDRRDHLGLTRRIESKRSEVIRPIAAEPLAELGRLID